MVSMQGPRRNGNGFHDMIAGCSLCLGEVWLPKAIHPLGIMGLLPISHPSLSLIDVSNQGEWAVTAIPSTGGKQCR